MKYIRTKDGVYEVMSVEPEYDKLYYHVEGQKFSKEEVLKESDNPEKLLDEFIIDKENELRSIEDSIRMARKWKAKCDAEAADVAEDAYDAKLEKLGEITPKMTLTDYCKCMAACLNSQYGEYDEYCDDCLFKDCCVMNQAPDTMMDELTGYEWAAYKESQKVQDKKVEKYDKIAAIVREK